MKSPSRRSEQDVELLSFIDRSFSPLRNEWRPPRGNQHNRNRQLYLQSYPFSREQTVSDKLAIARRKLKAAAWAVIACNCKANDTRKLMDSVGRKVRKYFGTCRCIPASLSGSLVHRSTGFPTS